jgi:hypothetical protein
LVAWWRCEGNALDSSGTNNGTLQGGVTFAAGEVGQTFSFNGIDGSVLVPDAPALRVTNALTIEAWICPKSVGAAQGILLKWFGNGNQLSYSTAIETTGQAYLLLSQNGLGAVANVDYKVVYSTNTVHLNQWTHFAGVYDGAWLKVYLNGVMENQALWTNGIFPGTAPLYIGEATYQSPFNGLIDEPSVYNRALTDAEIQQIYNAGSAGKCPAIAPALTSQPASQTVLAGATATFTVTATGTPPLSYQWGFNGTNIAGATGTSLTLSNVQPAQAGTYSVQVTNAYGSTNSANAILTVTSPPPACIQAPAGLVSWWQADGTTDDTIGGNNGILVNGVGFANGEVGQAFSFDGVSDYVKIPKAANLDAPSQLTIDFWMKADTNNPIGSRVEGLVTSDFYGFEIGTAASTPGVLFFISTDSGGHFVNTADVNGTGAVFPAGEWHHIAGVYDGAKVQLYLDGRVQGKPAPVTGQISPMLANSFVAIGSSDGRTVCGTCIGTRYFKGLIDEVDIFNRALSASEVAAIYNAGVYGKCGLAPGVVVPPTNQVVTVGTDVILSVVARGTPPLVYQWQFNGTNASGGTAAILSVTNVQANQSGSYAVVITNVYGVATSSIALLTVNLPPPCVPPPLGLVSWWRGEGDCLDAVGTNNGTLQNGATFARGEVGQAFSFDGVNDYVKILKSASLDAPNKLTIDFWMKADTNNPIGSRVEGLVTSDFYGFEIGTAASTPGVLFFISTDSGGHFVNTADVNGTGAVFPAGEWHHIAGVYDGAKVQLYLDGQALGNPAPVTGQISPMLANSFVAIGSSDGRTACGQCFGSRYFNGMIDEVDFFNRALLPSEIAAIYSAGAAGKCLAGLAPLITAQPASQTVLAGSTAAFTVTATGALPLSYQWSFDGTNIAGATGTSLTLSNVQPAQAGIYAVQVTNAYGSTNSDNAFLTVTSPPPTCVPAPAGLVSWWQADGTADDTIGGNDGILVNSAGFATGEVGQAFSFDGVNDYVKIPRAPSLDVSNQVTIDLWMKADPSAPIGSRLEGLVSSDFYGMEVGNAPAGVYLFLSTDNGASFVSTADATGQGAIFPVGEWHHVAGTYDGAKLQFYLDGQPYGNPIPVSGAISPMLSSSFVTLGSEDGRTKFPSCIGTRYFAGEIDEADIFNRALSASEIAAIYSAGVRGKCGLAAAVVVPPTNQVVTVGADVSFTAVARGTPPLAYQWQFNGTNVSGGTTAILSVTNVQYSQSGSYSIVVTNAYGAATSSIAMLTINPPPPCTVPPAGLVSWWRGEGDALDESGVNSGTLQNGATFARGEVGQAFSFDGTNDFVKIPRAPNLDVGSQLTIDLWMKADPSAPIGSRLEGLVGSDFYGMEVGNAPAGVFLFISTNDGASFKTTADVNGQGAIFPVGEWHHVAGTYDGAKLQFFLDGQPYGNPTPASGAISPMLSSSFVTLGSEDGRTKFPFVIGTRYFAGELDEVDIFNRALSASEIAAIYQAGSTGKCRSPHTATATASLANGFVVGVTISNHGWGYTNTPVVKIIGGGGSGAQAVAVVSNGQLVAINILDAGSGYTNTPVVVIEPPFVPQLMVAIETASLLSFSSLAVGTNYQLQYFKGNTWSNLGAAFAASSPTFTQYVPGTVGSNDYRLATTPVPTQAYATAQLLNGFVIGATVTSGGSGYTTNPAVSIVGGGGSNATAVATVAGGVVTKITITDAGIGYTSTPSIVISPPPASALWPMVAPALALSLTNLSPYDNYQVEFTPALGGAWSNSGLPFTPTSTVNTQYVNEAGEAGFFRVKYVP